MKNKDIENLSRKELDRTLTQVEKVVMRKYITEIEKRPVFSPSYDISFDKSPKAEGAVFTVGTNIMLTKLKQVVVDKDENILDKLTTTYCATAMYESATLVMLLKSDGEKIDIYLGCVSKKTEDSFVPKKQITALIRNFESNFPGSKIEEIIDSNEKIEIVQDIFEKNLCISAVTGVAALKNTESNENIKYVQGLEKLTDSLRGKSCTVMVIADPIERKERHNIRSGYEELYSALKPFEKSEYSINTNNSETVTDTIMRGVTDTVNDSIAKTNTHTVSKGTSASHTVGGSIGVNASYTTTANFVAGSVSGTVGGSVSADYHYTTGSHEDTSDSQGTTETTGTSKALSEQNSIANALSTSNGEGLQITFENKSIKSIIEKIDLQIERLNECEDYGMFDCGVYFLSEDYTTCLSVASTYKSIIQGDNSSVDVSHISIWDEKDSKYLIPYLALFNHPIFDVTDEEENKFSATVSTLVSGRELAIYMGLPKKSISGIPVIQCTSFGRNILYNQNRSEEKGFYFGNIHHMHADEVGTKVLLKKESFTSHAFVTGSTGSGKSNAIYQLISKLCLEFADEKEQTHFMVIEPAKGEYKEIFGGYDNVQVYGTNPYHSKLLKINPFSFPENIHVLEHIDRIIEIFNVCWPMYAAMPAVLKEAIERAYESSGWNLTTSRCKYEINKKKLFPNFIDVLKEINHVINESKYSADSKGDYIGALSMRIGSLTNGINGLIFTSDEISYEELFDKNVIIDLSRIGSLETKSLIMGLLIVKLQEYRMATATSGNSRLKHITILEEAHNILKRTSTEQTTDSSNLAGKSVEMLANAIAEMRTYGEGFVIVDQSPGLMDMSVIRNTNTKIILRLPDITDRELVGKAANLNDSQIVELSRLKTGVAAIYQNNWIEPVLCHIEEWNNKRNKSNISEKEHIVDGLELKKNIIKLVLKPPYLIDLKSIERIFEEINKTFISSSLKIKLLKIIKEKDVNKYRKLRESIVYEIFSPDNIIEKNIGYRNEIKDWWMAMKTDLEPNLDSFTDDEARKILAILAYKKNITENNKEYEELLNNLINFIDSEKRYI